MSPEGQDGIPPSEESDTHENPSPATVDRDDDGAKEKPSRKVSPTLSRALRTQTLFGAQLPSPLTQTIVSDAIKQAEVQRRVLRLLRYQVPERIVGGYMPAYMEDLRKLAASSAVSQITKWSLSPAAKSLLATVNSAVFQDALKVSERIQNLAATSIATKMDNSALSSLVNQAAVTSRLFDSVSVSMLQARGDRLAEMQDALALPTVTFERSASVLGDWVPELEPRRVDAPADPVDARSHRRPLELALERIDSRLARAYRGACHAMETGSPDAFRQTAVSLRELLRELLDELAPKDQFTDEEVKHQGQNGQATRRMQVSRIVGTSLGPNGPKLVDRLGQLTTGLYDYASDVAHTGREVPLEDMVLATEAYLVNLLRQAGYLDSGASSSAGADE